MTSGFDEDGIRHWLVDYLVTNIGCSPEEIDFDAPLNDLAVGSSDAVVLTGELSELLGRTISPVDFWQYPTVNALARYLTGDEPETQAEVSGTAEAGGFTDEPIAVIGLGCRFPGDDGDIRGPEAFWRFLCEGRSAVRKVPADRWEWFGDGSPEESAALAATTRWGSFLDQVDAFDADFFEISAREATKMDPQQRLLLEVTHEALEHAGIPAASLRHTQTGVFAGACVSEYGVMASTELDQVDAWTGTGGALSIIANRVSYFFDLRGPSVTVDTACSSSLVAIHLACQSLRSGDASLALAGGVNLLLSPAITQSFDQLGALSASGRCHSFDAAADGFVRGEGAGVVVLKRLGDARRDGDRVLAVVRGSAVNQDGRSNGLMAPNPAAQMAVLRSAYAHAGVEPRDVGYIEAHGTGTLLGDPIEARALGTVLGRGRAADAPLLLGAVKSNLGHLEAAAGVAGFVKAVLALQQGTIPANLGYQTPNPHIPFDKLRLKVVDEQADWPSDHGPRRAGVSSFGFGGTNAHVVLEQAPAGFADQADAPGPAAVVSTFVVSGKSAARIASTAGMLADWMEGPGAGVGVADVAHTLNHHRSRHARFATVCARDRLAAVAGLRALAAGQSAPGVVGPYQGAQPAPGTVFVYSGQGSQWPGMARQLMADEPVFAAAVAELESDFVAQVGFSLQQVIEQGQSVSGDAQVQPVLMGLQLALTELWRSYGVYPDAVIGHSMGEVTAAVVAGALSPAEGLKVIALRSTLMSELAGRGAVGLLEMDAEAVQGLLTDYPGMAVAGYLSARQTVVAGPPEQVDAVIATVSADNRFARRVNMEVASHTALMDPVLDRLREALADLRAGTPTLPFISTVAETEGEVTLDADYWVANVRQPVRFHQAVTAAGAEHGTFVEVSPHPVLTAAIIETLGTDGHHVIATLSRDGDDTLNFHTNLNATHTAHPPETEHRPEPHQQLPTTPWHHEHFWAKARLRADGTGSAPRPGTLLGEHIAVAGTPPAHLWQARLVPAAKPYPGFHRFNGVELVPLSVLLHTLSVAAAECGAPKVSDVRFEYPVTLDTPRVIQVFATEGSITVSSSPTADTGAGKWVRHLTARLNYLPDDGAMPGPGGVGVVQTDLDAETIEHRYREWGIEGHAFAWTVESCRTAPGELHAVISSPESASPVVLLDAAANVARMVDRDDPRLLVPTAVDGVRFGAFETGSRGSIEVTRRPGDDFVLDIVARTPDGTELAAVTGLRYADMDSGPAAAADPQSVAHILEWQPWDIGDAPMGAGSVAVIGNSRAAGALRDGLNAAGHATAAVDDARFVVYVADPGAPGDDLDCAVAMTAEVGDLVRRLTDRDPRNPGTLWILTAGVRDGADDAALRQSPLWGLAGVIGAEQPQIWGALVDISAGESMTDTASVLAGALAASAKSVLSLRDSRLFVSDLAALPGEPAREALRCRPEAAYLVTGGMGALGLLTADWLADRGARRLVLAGRTPLPPRREWDSAKSDSTESDLTHKIAAIRALEKRGVSVETVALDIGSVDAVAAWLARRDADGAAPIRGIVHAAGMTEAQLVTDLEIPRIEQTMWPKVAGARVLHEAFPPGSVDFFYLTASAGAVFGIPGQGAYAAANAYLDCLARVRHRLGCQTVSLDWVAWQGLGFGADAEIVVDELARLGSRPVVPAEAFGAWELVSRYDIAQAVMIPQPATGGGPSAGDGDARGVVPARDWSQLAPEELRTELTNGLRTILAGELRLGEDEVDPDRPFAEMGLNSVMAMAIRREVEGLVGLELSATMLFNHPTMTSFVDYLAKTLVPGEEPEETADTAGDSAGGVLDSLFDSVESAGTESRI